MLKSRENDVKCSKCGHDQTGPVNRCAFCGAQLGALSGDTLGKAERSAFKDNLKTQWVAAVIAFWISVVVLGVVFILQSRISLVLVSICLGLMILGIGLKIRYQLHLRKDKESS